MKLSIIIPVYNEENTIGECLKRIDKVILPRNIKKEIVVVDDGSTDSSKFKVQTFVLSIRSEPMPRDSGRGSSKFKLKANFKIFSHKINQGKGAAIRTGLKFASGDYVVIQDADLEYDPADFKKLLMPILEKKAEVVYGSRFLGEHKSLFFWHMLANKLLSLLTNVLYDSTLSDMEVGYKVFPRKLALSLNLKENRFGFEPEVTAKILKRKIRIYEIPISYLGREYHEGKKITWLDGIKAIFILLKYRFFD